MKTLLGAVVVAMVLAMGSYAKDVFDAGDVEDPNRFSPAISLEDALGLAKDHVREKKIATAGYYLKSINMKFEDSGKRAYWESQWMTTNTAVKGDWFIIRVDMDKSCHHHPGK